MIGTLTRFIRNSTVAKASLIMIAVTIAAKMMGYAEKIIVAYQWGTSDKADVYYSVTGIIIGMALFFRELFEPALLNTLTSETSSRGMAAGNRVYKTFLRFMMFVCLFCGALVFLYPDLLVSAFLPGFADEKYAGAVLFFRYGSFAFFLLAMLTVINTYLLSKKMFFIIAISDFAYKAIIVVILMALTAHYGIYAALIAFLAGALMKFIIQAVGAGGFGRRDIATDGRFVRNILLLSTPLLIGNIFSQIGNIVQNVFASYMQGGALSSLTYAKKLIDLPVVLIPFTLSMVVFPYFSRLSIKREREKMTELFADCVKYIVLFFLPAMLLVGVCSRQIICVVFEHGAFDANSTTLTSQALSVYNVGLLAFALETILVVYLFAQNRIKFAVIAGIVGVMADIAITWVSIEYVGYLGIAWGYVIGRWLKLLILSYAVRSDLRKLVVGTLGIWLKTAAASAVCLAVGLAYRLLISPHIEKLTTSVASLLLLAVFFYLIFYILPLRDVLTVSHNVDRYES